MKKKMLMLLTSMLLVCMMAANIAYAATADGTDTTSDTVTRAQWLSRLADTFGFEVDQDNYPDNYYADITSDSEYYSVIMMATEFGVLDIEAGENAYPDQPATREFAAQTLNYCLGFQLDSTEYTYSDSADTKYPADLQVAVNRGWFTLEDGKVLPAQNITTAEMTAMLADAAAIQESTVVDDNHDDVYKFADFVKVMSKTIQASVDENDVVTIKSAATKIEKGDTFVVWTSSLPAIYVAESVTVSDGVTTITTSEADTSKAIVSVDASGNVSMDLSQFQEADGVSVQYSQAGDSASLAGITTDSNSVTASKDITLSNGAKASIKCELSGLTLSQNINTANHTFYVSIKGKSNISSTVTLDAVSAALGSSSVTLGSVRVAGVGTIKLSVDLALNGKITASYAGSFETGMQYSDKDGFRITKSFQKESFTTTAEANASLGVKLEAGLDVYVVKGTLYAKTGISAKFKSSNYNDGKTPKNCTQISAWLYVSVGAEASVNILVWSKSWTKDLIVYDETNSPVRLSFHYEDGKQVSACSRKDSGSKASTKYITSGDSKYGTSSYGDVSSKGTDSEGNEITLWEYTISDDYATITAYKGNTKAVAVPQVLDGYKVTKIDYGAFKNNRNIVRVSIPEGVESIENYAFSGCRALTSVTLPESLTSMGYGLIEDTAVEGITIPKNVVKCDYYSSYGTYAGPLSGCKTLKKVVFEEGMTTIPAYACYYSSYLEQVIVPSTIETIDGSSFYNCTRLKSISIPEGVQVIWNAAFAGCSGLGELVIPKTVSTIGDYSFQNCSGINTVTIEENTKTGFKVAIGGYAFENCSGIENLNMSKNVVSLGGRAFSGCTSLEGVDMPEGIQSIGDYAFSGCTALTGIAVSEGVTSIGDYVFSGCRALKSVTLPESLTSMGYGLIEDTAVESITIPKNVTKCDYNSSYGALYGCKTLKNVVFEEGMTTIPAYACYNAAYIESVTIPSTVTSIGSCAFSGCTNLKTVNYLGTADTWKNVTIGTGNDALVAEIISYHTHKYDQQEVVAPTCTTAGYTLHTCSACGNTYKTDSKAALGHTEVVTAGKDATCTEDGISEGITCSVCGLVIKAQTTIPAKGHDYKEKITKKATCEADGTATYTCTVCGDTYDDVIKATGHDFSITKVTKEATCVDDGIRTLYCSACGTSKEENIPATGEHTYKDTIVPGTCKDLGYTLHECTVCGDSYKDTYTPMGDHTWDEGVVTKEATTTETGIKTYTCTVCGETKTEIIPVKTPDPTPDPDPDNPTTEEPTTEEPTTENPTTEVTKKTQKFTGTDSYTKTDGDGAFALDVDLAEGDGALTFVSSDDKVVKVSSRGLVTVVGAGTAKITVNAAETTAYYSATFTIDITVKEKTVIPDPDNPTTEEPTTEDPTTEVTKKTQKFTGTVSYTKTEGDGAFALDVDLSEGDGALTFVSSDDKIVKVSSRGLVTIVGAGTAKITVNAAETTAYYSAAFTIDITVKKKIVIPDPDKPTTEEPTTEDPTTEVTKKTQKFTGTDSYTKTEGDGAFALDVDLVEGDGVLTFVSSDDKVVKVSSRGLATVIGAGTAKITVNAAETTAYYSATFTINVTVKAKTVTPPKPAVLKNQVITARNITKTYTAAAFGLGAKTNGNGKLSYKSSNTGIARVDSKGRVSLKGYGKVKITINAAKTSSYKAASKTITITVKPKKMALTSVKSSRAKTMTVKWKRDSKASMYCIRYSTDKRFKKGVKTVWITRNSATSVTLGKLKPRTKYYVRIAAVKKSGSSKLAGAYSAVKAVTVKK